MKPYQQLQPGLHSSRPSSLEVTGALQEIHYVMGTLLAITLHDQTAAQGKRVLQACFQEARRLEELFSTFDESSDLSQLNQRAGEGPIEIDRELWSLLELSLRLGRETDEALDVTIGPLIDLWRTAEEQGAQPSPTSVADALRRTGLSKVHLLPDGRGELRQAGMRLDLGGIGKGYAVDRLKELLVAEGVERAFVNFGRSSLAAVGSPPERDAWPVLLQADTGEPVGLVHLKDQCLSVSGSFGHSYEIGDTHLGHLIDPRNGSPLCHGSLGVALARTATEAEALTKALVILGPALGFRVVNRFPTAEGLLILPDGSRIRTSGFDSAVRFDTEEVT